IVHKLCDKKSGSSLRKVKHFYFPPIWTAPSVENGPGVLIPRKEIIRSFEDTLLHFYWLLLIHLFPNQNDCQYQDDLELRLYPLLNIKANDIISQVTFSQMLLHQNLAYFYIM